MVDTLTDSLAEMDGGTLGYKLIDAQALVEKLADSLAEVKAETLDDKLSDKQAMLETLADLHKHSSTRWLSSKQRCRKRR